MLFSKYNSLNYAKYLNNCDLNYKYFLKSITETPSVDKIIVELPTNMLPNIETTEDDYQNRLLLKCFLALYFTNFKVPYVNCNEFRNKEIVSGTKSSFHYAYITSYKNTLEKYQLLSELFNDNDYSNQGTKTLTKLNKPLITSQINTDLLNFRLEILASRVSDYKEVLNLLFERGELQKVKLKLNVVFKKFNAKFSSSDEFRNFFFM